MSEQAVSVDGPRFRPTATSGWVSWLTTTDHKKVAVLYLFTTFVFFFLGGVQAWLIRVQIAQAELDVISEEVYNQVFTMHGVTMIFLVVMPLGSAFFNYLIPLQIGARDVAFPRLNAFSYWTYLLGGIFLYSSFFIGGAPNGGWFAYAPLASDPVSNMAMYAVGLNIVGVGTLASAVNFIATILNMRAPGLHFMRMPAFVWMTLITNFLLLFAMPIITVATLMLMFDTVYTAQFFQAATGGDPVLYQHLFWLFGHPEVYIMVLPAMAIVSEILPVFSRKPLFGYAAVMLSGVAIAFIGFGVWAHHMFTSPIGPLARSGFAIASMAVAIPTGIKIFNWIFTMWGGKLRFTTPMLFCIGFVSMFTIGGLSGVTHAVVPHNAQQHDTYYIVAHFHYVLFGGSLFALVAGIYYWFPKATGKLMDERLGKWHFWTWLLGFNLIFAPMHLSGLLGQPRRTAVLPAELGPVVEFYNLLSTIGVGVLTVSAVLFLTNLLRSIRHGEPSGDDPWDARTLEWITTSPPPTHNFDTIPTVHSRDEFWHRKYTEDDTQHAVRIPDRVREVDGPPETHIHLPDPSFWPLTAAVGMLPLGYGLAWSNPWLFGIGVAWLVTTIFAWINEPLTEGDDDDPAATPPPPDDAVHPGDADRTHTEQTAAPTKTAAAPAKATATPAKAASADAGRGPRTARVPQTQTPPAPAAPVDEAD